MISSRSLNVHGISVYKKRRGLSLNSPYSSFFVNDLDWHTLKEVTVQAHPLFLVFLAVTGFV